MHSETIELSEKMKIGLIFYVVYLVIYICLNRSVELPVQKYLTQDVTLIDFKLLDADNRGV